METDVNSPSMLKTCYAAVGNPKAVTRVARIAFARAEKILERDPNNGTAMGYGVTRSRASARPSAPRSGSTARC